MKNKLSKLNKLFIALVIGISYPKKIYKALVTLFLFGWKDLIIRIKTDEIYMSRTGNKNQFYKDWLRQNILKKIDLINQKKESEKFRYKPTISIITPVYNTDEIFLRECINSVLNQTYENWELCIADDASTNPSIRKIIKRFAKKDRRIKFVFRKKNGNIARASNSALSLATGEFVGLLDHDDILRPNALYEATKVLNSHSGTDFIYTDEDKIDSESKEYTDPFFKPDWSPDLLYSFMYVGHFTVYRRNLVERVGGFDPKLNYSQDYDLALKISEKTKNIFHIDKILYSWRVHEGSQTGGGKPYARKSNLEALSNHMKRRGLKGRVIEYPFANKFDYEINEKKKVSIVIPSDSYENSLSVITSLIKKTTYRNYEIILVINRQVGDQVKRVVKDNRLKIVYFDKEFNFSEKCNIGANKSSGEFLIFLNDDMELISENWIEGLIEFFQRKEVGAVSPKLLYADGTIQHAGMVTGVRNLVGTAFHKRPYNSIEYFKFIQATRNCSILSAACLAIPKNIFNLIEGFDEKNTPISHSDIDLSFKIRDRGYLLIYTPFVTLRHYGHKSIGEVKGDEDKKIDRLPDLFLLNKWGEKISYDPYYPPAMRDFLYGHGFSEFKIIPSKKYNDFKTNKNLLFVGHESSLTGAPLLIFWLANKLLKKRYHVIFYLPNEGPIVSILSKFNFTVIVDSEIFSFIRDETKQFIANFDLVICNTINNWKMVLASKEIGAPTIFYIHESQYGVRKIKRSNIGSNTEWSAIRKAFELADKVIYPSMLTYKRYFNILALNNGISVLPGINFVKSQKKEHRKNKLFTILNIGSIEKRKGQILLLNAFILLNKKLRNKMKLIFVGRILDEKYFRKLKIISRGKQNIEFIGELDRENILKLYNSSDLFVCSSLDETGPLTLVEAVSNFVPIITTKVGLVPEVFTNLKDALILGSRKPESLKNAIELLFRDIKLREKLKENAYQNFIKNLTIDSYTARVEEIMQEVLDR